MRCEKKDLLNWIDKLKKIEAIILVEGKKDIHSLNFLGIENILAVKGKPLYQIVEEVSAKYKTSIILVDLDKEGKKLYSYLNKNLSEHGVKVDNQFRIFLFKYTEVRQIECLAKYIENLE